MRVNPAAQRFLAFATLALLTQLPACGPTVPSAISALNEPPGIASLLKERLRSDLTNGVPAPTPFSFPVRVRVVPYDYQTGLQQVDVLGQFATLADTLKKHPELVSDASVLPAAYGDSVGASFDGLMKLSASVHADVFLLVSGRTVFAPASEKNVSFFDWWAHKSYYEAHVSLDALWVEAPSGHFLPSFQAAAKAGPEAVVPDDNSTGSKGYGMRRTVEGQAFKQIADALITQLGAERAAAKSASATSASALPSASPTSAVSATPATAEPTPSPVATVSQTPTSSPSAVATDKAATPAAGS